MVLIVSPCELVQSERVSIAFEPRRNVQWPRREREFTGLHCDPTRTFRRSTTTAPERQYSAPASWAQIRSLGCRLSRVAAHSAWSTSLERQMSGSWQTVTAPAPPRTPARCYSSPTAPCCATTNRTPTAPVSGSNRWYKLTPTAPATTAPAPGSDSPTARTRRSTSPAPCCATAACSSPAANTMAAGRRSSCSPRRSTIRSPIAGRPSRRPPVGPRSATRRRVC